MPYYYAYRYDEDSHGDTDESYSFSQADQRMAMAMCGIITLLFMIIACIALYKGLARGEEQKSRTTPEDISRVLRDQTEVLEAADVDEDQECSVCLVVAFVDVRGDLTCTVHGPLEYIKIWNGLRESEGNLRKLRPCGHLFHDGCITGWFESSTTRGCRCPLCRTDLTQTGRPPSPSTSEVITE